MQKWNAVKSLIEWSSLPKEEINKLKKEMIYSDCGWTACVYLICSDNNVKAINQFTRWCFASEEEVNAYKKELIFSDEGTRTCAELVNRNELELLNDFINSSENEVRELKKEVAYRFGSTVCDWFILDSKTEKVYDNLGDVIAIRIKFKGGKWEGVEMFLTWCSSSEEEISDFKKNKLLKRKGKEIHFRLITSNRWEEAEIFFAWLGLSAEEIKELKKETLFHHRKAGEKFRRLMYSEEGDYEFVDYGSKQEAIELFLR